MQEWIDSILSTDWLLGFAMGVAGRRIIDGVNMVRYDLLGQRKPDEQSPSDDQSGKQ